ncbi:MAG: FIST N-terminal domain-containing protein [Candidatus Eisenbacteria bacterium]
MNPGPRARWASAHSTLADSGFAMEEAGAAIRAEMGEGPVDLVLLFLGAAHVRNAEAMSAALRARLTPGCLMGAGAHGVVCRDHEVETGPAVSVVAARLPGVSIRPFLLTQDLWRDALGDAEAFASAAPGVLGAEVVLMLADPFSLDMERVLAAFHRHAKGVRIAGGMASAAPRPRGNVVLLNDWASHEGGVAVALHGPIRADVIVSQGCRPVGPLLTVTRAEGNLILELDGQPAVERAEQALRALADHEREALQNGLYVGRPARAGAEGRGDWLIRNLLGADRSRGAIAVADIIAERERVRLHVRDRETAREDLEMLLSPQAFDARPDAALLFACNGRGRGLYGRPDGDLSPLQKALGNVPAAGMFCAGEIGPVGERNFLHGHTASIVILREAVRRE